MTRFVSAAVLVAAVCAAPAARAQEMAALNQAVESYNAGKYDDAALVFFDVAERAGEPELAWRAEYYLALSLFKLGLHHSALYYDSLIIGQGPNHPYYRKAVENLLEVMDAVGDKSFIPNMLDKEYNEAFADLPPDVINRINFLVALWSHRQTKVEESAEFLDFVPRESSAYPRARYLRGVQHSQEAARSAEPEQAYQAAAKLFEEVRALQAPEGVTYPGLSELKELSTIALARVRYAEGQFAEAAALYDTIPRFSRHWRDALFESGYAWFMADNPGQALGRLHNLHAPVAGDQLLPESWLLKAHIYYFNCLFDESKATVAHLQKRYQDVAAKVKKVLEENDSPEFYWSLVAQGEASGGELPAMVRNDILVDETLRSRRNYVYALEEEATKLKSIAGWDKSLLQEVLIDAVQQQKNGFIQVAGKTVQQHLRRIEADIADIDGQAEILKFEMAKREKDLLESGHDKEKVLAEQPLYRPAMPPKGVEYWQFEGEFWPDELGFYRYTLKNACPADERVASAQ